MLLPPHPHHSYFATNSSVGAAVGAQRGTSITSGTANAYGSWVQIHAGLTYPSEWVIVQLNAVETSADVIAATTLNAYFDIGIGPDTSNVTVIVEKLNGSQAQGLGHVYYLPLRIPPDTPVFARHQNTAASARGAIAFSAHGGNMNPGSMPTVQRIVALGATTASTTGTAITPGASGAEGAWTQIVASTTEDYAGVLISPLFNVDTTLTSGLYTTFDASIGSAGNELTIGENLTQSYIHTANEQRDAVSFPTFVGIPTGSRLCVRASGSAAADGTNSVMLYGLMH